MFLLGSGGTAKPTNLLSEGAKLGHKLVEEEEACCNQKMRPIPPWQIINYDFTSTYTCRWTSGRVDHGLGDEWVVRVPSKSLLQGVRNHASIKTRGEDILCNGISVKWLDCGTSASGSVFPMTSMLFGGFEESVMPQDDFVLFVIDVAGLSVNGQLDARQHDAPGLIVFKTKGVSMQEFFSWYTNRVTRLPYYQVLRERNELTNRVHIPEPENARRIWSDSDMTNIGAITAPQEMDWNYKNSLEFGKLGAKTTALATRLT
jgi:hypothetical protein